MIDKYCPKIDGNMLWSFRSNLAFLQTRRKNLRRNLNLRSHYSFQLFDMISSKTYLPVPQVKKPDVLLQIAVRVLVVVVIVYLMLVDVPKANKNRLLSMSAGREKPAWISNGITASSETDLVGVSTAGSAL